MHTIDSVGAQVVARNSVAAAALLEYRASPLPSIDWLT